MHIDKNYLKTTTLEAISAIETKPKIVHTKIESSFSIKKYNPIFKKERQNQIKNFVISLKEIFGEEPIMVSYPWDNKATREPLDKVLLKTCSTDTLLLYLIDNRKNEFVLKSGFSPAKTIPYHVNYDSTAINELRSSKGILSTKDAKNNAGLLKELSLFNAESFCPIFYTFHTTLDVSLIGFFAIGKNRYKNNNSYEISVWHYIAASMNIRLMQVVDYIMLEAAKRLKDHFECLGYDGDKMEETISLRKSLIKNIGAYRNLRLNLNKLIPSLYGFKAAWKIFEIFSNPQFPK